MSTGKIVALVSGILIVLIGLALVVPGAVLLGLYGTQRDSDGFFHTSSRVMSTKGSALVTPDVDLDFGPHMGRWLLDGDRAAIRIDASPGDGRQLFVGVGPSSDVAAYLQGVDYDEVTDFGWAWSSVEYRHVDGTVSALPPTDQDFWVAEQVGSDAVTLDWNVQDGSWTAVIMNADGSAPVWAEVSVGARLSILLGIGIGITVGGVVLLAVGIVLIVIGARRPPTPPSVQAQMPQQMPTTTGVPPTQSAPPSQ